MKSATNKEKMFTCMHSDHLHALISNEKGEFPPTGREVTTEEGELQDFREEKESLPSPSSPFQPPEFQ